MVKDALNILASATLCFIFIRIWVWCCGCEYDLTFSFVLEHFLNIFCVFKTFWNGLDFLERSSDQEKKKKRLDRCGNVHSWTACAVLCVFLWCCHAEDCPAESSVWLLNSPAAGRTGAGGGGGERERGGGVCLLWLSAGFEINFAWFGFVNQQFPALCSFHLT